MQQQEFSFELAPVDITKLPLTVEEGYIIARMIGRRVTAGDLVREGVTTAKLIHGVIESLVRKGAIVRVGGGKKPDGDDPYAGVIFNAGDLHEAADITEDQKKRILFVEMNLEKWSHYKLLGLKKTSKTTEIKQGYFKASKEFHPDAYFRKSLGSYKERVDRIFRTMKIAYETISDPKRREHYDATAVIELTPEEEEELARLLEVKRQEQLNKQRDVRNEQRMKESRLKRNPMTERIRRGKELMELAYAAEKLGKIDEAATHARVAVGYNEALRPVADHIIMMAERGKAAEQMKRVQQILASPQDLKDMKAELNTIIDEASEIAVQTKDPQLLVDVARNLLLLKRPVQAAKLAHFASELDSRNPRAWEALAEAASADGKWAILLKASERWLALEPKAARAKDLLKEAKRNT